MENMEGTPGAQSKIEAFKGGLSGNQEGLRLEVTPDIRLSILKETASDSKSGEEKFSGIKGMFSVKDQKGEMHTDSKTAFVLMAAEGMREEDIPEVMKALATLVRMGAKPEEVTNFVSEIQAKRTREHVKKEYGV